MSEMMAKQIVVSRDGKRKTERERERERGASIVI